MSNTESDVCREIEEDFERRQRDRKALERAWQLNMNFVNGNQYCHIDPSGEICEDERAFLWQSRRVFNHIAPTIDTRCAKLSRIRPALTVKPASDDERDRKAARLSAAILAAVAEEQDLDDIVGDATVWSEVCGTVFYKIVWDARGGRKVGEKDNMPLFEGDVKVLAVPPFEIYPYSLSEEKLSRQPSIIHARAVPVQEIYSSFGVKLAGRDIDEFAFAPCAPASRSRRANGEGNVRRGHELLIERYEKPTADMPEGRLTVVAGGKLLSDGPLPYINGKDGGRTYPFVKQISQPSAGCFFGSSVVERLVPVQRAYNAVINRRHEFLNRVAMGTVAVEDGSVDCDDLAEDGLTPGKIIVYRQGSKPPEMLTLGGVPEEFFKEEDTLLTEFSKISGTGDLSENADSFAGVTSATGLQLIIEQDDARLNGAYSNIKRALKETGKHILRLYRQFAAGPRLARFGGGESEFACFKGSDISGDDVTLEADTDLNLSPAQKRTVIYEMIDKGLFSDGDGKLTAGAKNKILDLLGYGSLASGRDLTSLHAARAEAENASLLKGGAEIKEYDDHAEHIGVHTAYLLTRKLSAEQEARICAHIQTHKNKLSEVENGKRNAE